MTVHKKQGNTNTLIAPTSPLYIFNKLLTVESLAPSSSTLGVCNLDNSGPRWHQMMHRCCLSRLISSTLPEHSADIKPILQTVVFFPCQKLCNLPVCAFVFPCSLSVEPRSCLAETIRFYISISELYFFAIPSFGSFFLQEFICLFSFLSSFLFAIPLLVI